MLTTCYEDVSCIAPAETSGSSYVKVPHFEKALQTTLKELLLLNFFLEI